MTPARSIGKCTDVTSGAVSVEPPRRHERHPPSGPVARCEAFQTLPRALRERRRGVEEEVEVGEEALGQRVVLFERSREPLEAARDVEVQGRRHLSQVRNRLVEPPRRGLAGVDVERSAARQHHVEVVVPAERVAPGEPVDDDGGALREERPHLGDRLLVRAEHPLRVDHPLGCSGRARREEDLRDRVRSDRGARAVERDPRRGAPERAHCCVRGAPAREEGDAGERGGERVRVQGRVVGEDDAWAHRGHNLAQLGEVARDQRVRGGDGRGGDRCVHRGELDERVVNAVFEQENDGAIGRRAEVEQPLRDRADGRKRLRVRDAAPPARRVALGEERARRSFPGPPLEPVAHPARERSEGLRRPEDEAAPLSGAQRDDGRCEAHVRGPRNRRGPSRCRT